VVDIEHRRLAALEEHGLARVESLVEYEAGVGDHRPQSLHVREQVIDDLIHADRASVVNLDQQVVLLIEGALDLLAQDVLVEEILPAYVGPMPRPVVPICFLPRKRSVTLSIVR
jgi:hypothetical protein